MNRREIYQALLDGSTVVYYETEIHLDEDGNQIDQHGDSRIFAFDNNGWNIKLNVKRYWLWDTVLNNGWCRSSCYIDDDGIKTNGHPYVSAWEPLLKRKIEDDYIDINSKGELV